LATGRSWLFYIDASNQLALAWNFGPSALSFGSGVNVIPLNTWTHVALVSSGGTFSLYVNGALTNSISSGGGLNPSSDPVVIGGNNDNATPTWLFPGYISNFRIVNGVAVYTGNFTPPNELSTTQSARTNISAITGTATKLLTCTSSQIIDYSSNRASITVGGTAPVSTTIYPPFDIPTYYQKEFPVSKMTTSGSLITSSYLDEEVKEYAAQFNGSTQYLNATITALNTSNFTVECWIYATSFAAENPLFKIYTSATANLEIRIPNGVLTAIYNSSSATITGSTLSINTWYHIALVRYNNILTMYINGTSTGTPASITGTMTSPTIYIARNQSGSAWFAGFISNFRIVKGTALYTTTFLPPVAPLTPITNTILLTCQSRTIVDNSPSPVTITNNATVTTSLIPSTFYIGLFGGGTQYLSTPSNTAFTFGTGDFTLEAWVYRTGTNPVNSTFSQNIFDFRSTEPQVAMNIGFDNGSAGYAGKIYVYINGAYPAVSTTVIALNTWYHVAYVRLGGAGYLYINGVREASHATSSTYSTSVCYIGGRFAAVTGDYRSWQGSISNARVTKGIGLYTSNFVPPTTQLIATPNTSLLALQSSSVIKDNSFNNFTLTNSGVTSITPISWPTVRREYSTGVTEISGEFNDATKFTTGSYSFNGLAGDNSDQTLGSSTQGYQGQYLTAGDLGQFNFLHDATTDYTFEVWINMNALPASGARTIFMTGTGTASDIGFSLITGFVYPNNIAITVSNGTSTNASAASANNYLTASDIKVWKHIAVTFNASTKTFVLYVNGVVVSTSAFPLGSFTTPSTYSYSTSNPAYKAGIGRYQYVNPQGYFNGYLSNLRITKQIVYTGAFTTPTSPLQLTQSSSTNIAAITDSTKVALLTCQYSDFSDTSLNNINITHYGVDFSKYKPV
jgi:hypothetical protein